MPFRVEDFHDLVRLLEERPEWRSELRRLVLTDELLALPEQVATSTEAQKRTEGQVAALATQVTVLTSQVAALATQVTALTSQVTMLTTQVEEVAKVQKYMGEQLTELADTVRTLADGVGHLKGEVLENRYRTKGLAIFGRILRRTHVLSQDELQAIVEEAIDNGVLADDQADDIYEADVIVHGKLKQDKAEAYLVVEVSWGVGPDDVARAARRAALFARMGVRAIPVVAGTWITPEASLLARNNQTWQLTESRTVPPDPLSS